MLMSHDQAIAMLRTMAAMQEEHNRQVHEQWRSQGYEYYHSLKVS